MQYQFTITAETPRPHKSVMLSVEASAAGVRLFVEPLLNGVHQDRTVVTTDENGTETETTESNGLPMAEAEIALEYCARFLGIGSHTVTIADGVCHG